MWRIFIIASKSIFQIAGCDYWFGNNSNGKKETKEHYFSSTFKLCDAFSFSSCEPIQPFFSLVRPFKRHLHIHYTHGYIRATAVLRGTFCCPIQLFCRWFDKNILNIVFNFFHFSYRQSCISRNWNKFSPWNSFTLHYVYLHHLYHSFSLSVVYVCLSIFPYRCEHFIYQNAYSIFFPPSYLRKIKRKFSPEKNSLETLSGRSLIGILRKVICSIFLEDITTSHWHHSGS